MLYQRIESFVVRNDVDTSFWFFFKNPSSIESKLKIERILTNPSRLEYVHSALALKQSLDQLNWYACLILPNKDHQFNRQTGKPLRLDGLSVFIIHQHVISFCKRHFSPLPNDKREG